MRGSRLLAATVAAMLVAMLTGCLGATSGGGVKGGSAANTQDAALVAERAASAAVEQEAPDAVLLMMGSQGVVMSPPPGNWSFMYGSQATGRTYRVNVDHGTAEKPEDMAELNVDATAMDVAIAPTSIQVGANEAYEAAKKYLEERDGSAPPNVMMSMTFVELPGLDQAVTGRWSIAFLNGTSTDGMQQVTVDAQTGEVAAVE